MIITFVFLVALIYLLISLDHLKSKKEFIICEYFFSDCSLSVFAKASVQNVVIMTTLSKKFIPQFYNFWLVSATKIGFTNIVIVAYDIESYLFSKKLSKYVLKNKQLINQSDEVVFINKDYVKVIMSRMLLTKYILDKNFSVFVIDTDIILFKNPLPLVLSHNDYDVVSHKEDPNTNDVCCGFMYCNKEY